MKKFKIQNYLFRIARYI